MQAGPAYTQRYVDALGHAATLHRHQWRKGGDVPYISHLLAVGSLVWEDGGDEDEAIAGLLHDAVEDAGGQPVLDEVRARYGQRVANLVEACTDAWGQPKPPWRERKEAHLERLRHEPDVGALRVVAADKTHNATTIVADGTALGAAVWDRFTASRDETVWYYRSAHAVLVDRLPDSELTHRLGALVDDLAALGS